MIWLRKGAISHEGKTKQLLGAKSVVKEPTGVEGRKIWNFACFISSSLLMSCQSECTYVLKEQRGHIDPVISLCPCYLTLRRRDILQFVEEIVAIMVTQVLN